MKHIKTYMLIAMTLILSVAVFASCAKKEEPKAMTPTAVVSDFSTQKDQYINDMQAKIDDYQKKIDALKEKAGVMTGTAKDQINQKIDLLTAKQEEAKGKLEELKLAGEDAWDRTKTESDSLLKDIDTLYNDALSLVK
jgi:peptidoglycan hydrolase CwlO-like protein